MTIYYDSDNNNQEGTDMVPTQKVSRAKSKSVVVAKQRGDHLAIKNPIHALNEAQRQMILSLNNGTHIVAAGSAGTGKTIVACSYALEQLFTRKIDKVIIIRSAVPVRDIGFLKGDANEKMDVYTAPYRQLINDLCGNDTAWDILTKKNLIEFIPTSYTRGLTFRKSIIIIDEFQNMTIPEVRTAMTRIDDDSQLIILGDTKQCDLNSKKDVSCYPWLMALAGKLTKYIDTIHFYPNDIVRSGFVKALILAEDEL
jgi:phosphate starvation-inducible protein PhoH